MGRISSAGSHVSQKRRDVGHPRFRGAYESFMTNKSKHTGLGIALGAALGAVAGAMAGDMGLWLAIGVAIGLVIGLSVRRRPAECPECEALHRMHAQVLEARKS